MCIPPPAFCKGRISGLGPHCLLISHPSNFFQCLLQMAFLQSTMMIQLLCVFTLTKKIVCR